MEHYLSRLQDRVRNNWNGLALCNYGGEGMTYGTMAARMEKLHILFSLLGIAKGDKIAICARNQMGWGLAFLAINTYECVAVPILADFHPDSIAGIMENSGSVMLFADRDIYERLPQGCMPELKRVFSVNDLSPLYLQDGDAELIALADGRFAEKYPQGFSASDVEYPQDNAGELAVINYTSGSTGQPKGVMLRYECFSANIDFAHRRIPSTPHDTILSILPMAHMFGLVFELLYPLCGGSTVYYLGKTPSPTLLMKAMGQVRPFMVIAVPMIFEKIYRNRLLPEMKKPMVRILSSIPFLRRIVYGKMRSAIDESFGGKVRFYIMGGAALNPEVESFMRRIGLHFTVGYGMTEAGPLLAYEDWNRFRLRTCGKAMDFVEFRVDSPDPARIPGEIQARGVNLFSGYYRNESATKAAFTPDGWFNTGDLGVIDRHGNVSLRGRSKSMLLASNGQNIYPEEIECIVNSQEYVSESVVVMRNDRLVALVLLNDDEIRKNRGEGGNVSEILESIRTLANRKLSRFCQLSLVEAVDKPFEKTPKMSIRRYLYS